MYIKWIVCCIKKNFEKEFSLAQEKWIKMQETSGLIGQIGGWDLKDKNTACVISFWEDQKSLEYFMQNIHDKIFLENKQVECYDSIEVGYFNSILSMEGECSSLVDIIKNAKLLRIADCFVKQNNIDHFEKVQNEIWLPGMKNSNGMLGGKFSQSNNNSSRYLVSTFWNSLENHDNYVENKLLKLKVLANVKSLINSITGRQIVLVDSWKIIKTTVNT